MTADRLRELADAATPGPWRECGADRIGCQCGNVWSIHADAPVGRVISNTESRLADARLIALAPELARCPADAADFIQLCCDDPDAFRALLARLPGGEGE